MGNASGEVDRFMAGLDHPMKAGVELLRSAILASNAHISEHISWGSSPRRAGVAVPGRTIRW